MSVVRLRPDTLHASCAGPCICGATNHTIPDFVAERISKSHGGRITAKQVQAMLDPKNQKKFQEIRKDPAVNVAEALEMIYPRENDENALTPQGGEMAFTETTDVVAEVPTVKVSTLTCEIGPHTWTRPAKRGRPPKVCPAHAVAANDSTEE